MCFLFLVEVKFDKLYVNNNMAGFRPGGLSDDEYSDEDQLTECDEVSKQYLNRDKAAASLRSEVWSMH